MIMMAEAKEAGSEVTMEMEADRWWWGGCQAAEEHGPCTLNCGQKLGASWAKLGVILHHAKYG